ACGRPRAGERIMVQQREALSDRCGGVGMRVGRAGVAMGRALRVGMVALVLTVAPPMTLDGAAQNSNPHLPPELNRVPDNNQANAINDQQQKKQDFEAANAARKKQ